MAREYSLKSALLVLLTTLSLSALLVLSFACGGGNGGGDGGETPSATEPAANGNGDGGGGAVSLDVSMVDNLFEPAELSVAAGASLTVNLTNDGTAIHNMRVAGEDGEYNTDDDAVSDPALQNAGESATLEWTAPSDAGEYIFRCDFHPTDMIGTITVE